MLYRIGKQNIENLYYRILVLQINEPDKDMSL